MHSVELFHTENSEQQCPEQEENISFLSRIFHPFFGFLSGWVSFIVGFSAPIAASAMGFSEYFCRAVPAMPEWISSAGIMNEVWLKKIISVSIILIFTFIHYRGIKAGARVQNLLTILKVLLIGVLLVAGFSSAEGTFTNFSREKLVKSRDLQDGKQSAYP